MNAHLIDIHGPDPICRAHQFAIVEPFQIRHVQHAELAKAHQQPDGHVVFQILGKLRLFRRGTAQRVGGTRARQRGLNQLRRGRYHQHVHSLQGNPVSRFHRDVADPVARLGVCLVARLHAFSAGLERPVVHDVFHRNAGNQQRHVAHVIDVVVGDHQVIDLFESGRLHRLGDPVRIAAVLARPAYVEQQGFPGGRDHQDGFSALHVDCVDVQGRGGP